MGDPVRRRRGSEGARKADIVPYWVYEGAHHIERYVPMLLLSREIDQLERLKRALAVYRMVFGQPRQEDLAAWLEKRSTDEDFAKYRELLRIDLSPPRKRGRSSRGKAPAEDANSSRGSQPR